MCLAVVWLGIVENTALEASGLTLGSIICPFAKPLRPACLVVVWLGTAEKCTGFRGFLWAGWWVGKRWLSFIPRAVLSLGRGHNLPKRWLSFHSKSCAFIRSRPHYLQNTVVSDVSWFLTPTRKLPRGRYLKKKKFQGTKTELISILKNAPFTGANAKPWPLGFFGAALKLQWPSASLSLRDIVSSFRSTVFSNSMPVSGKMHQFQPVFGASADDSFGLSLPLPAPWLYGTGQQTFKKKYPAIAQWIRVLLRLLQV